MSLKGLIKGTPYTSIQPTNQLSLLNIIKIDLTCASLFLKAFFILKKIIIIINLKYSILLNCASVKIRIFTLKKPEKKIHWDLQIKFYNKSNIFTWHLTHVFRYKSSLKPPSIKIHKATKFWLSHVFSFCRWILMYFFSTKSQNDLHNLTSRPDVLQRYTVLKSRSIAKI